MTKRYHCVVIGASAGGLQALFGVLGALPVDFALPIVVVQHLLPREPSALAVVLDSRVALSVVEASDKCVLEAGQVYVAVPDYHLSVEREGANDQASYHVGLSQEPRDCFSRPAINVLFESAAVSTEGGLIGIILTGANEDGARGAVCLKRWGGHLIVQEPSSAASSSMPLAALAAVLPDMVGTPLEIGSYLCNLGANNERRA